MDTTAIRSQITTTVAARSVSRATLVSRVVSHFGAANVSESVVNAEVSKMLNWGHIVSEIGDKGREMLHVANAGRTEIAVAVEKYIGNKMVSDKALRGFIAKNLGETATARQINGTLTGFLRDATFARVHTAKGYVIGKNEALASVEVVPVPERVISARGAKIAATRAANKAAKVAA